MKAKVKFDSKNKVWNVLGEYEGEWIKLGNSKAMFFHFLEFATKEEAEEYINKKEGLDK